MTRDQILGLPRPLRWAAQAVTPTGKHRARPDGALVDTMFVACGPCGGVESAATVHGGVVLCAEGHQQPVGGAL